MLHLWEMGTFHKKLPHARERIQRRMLQLRHSGTLSKILSQPAKERKQRKRERKRKERKRGMDERKREHEVSGI